MVVHLENTRSSARTETECKSLEYCTSTALLKVQEFLLVLYILVVFQGSCIGRNDPDSTE